MKLLRVCIYLTDFIIVSLIFSLFVSNDQSTQLYASNINELNTYLDTATPNIVEYNQIMAGIVPLFSYRVIFQLAKLLLFVFYYVLLTKMLKGRTLGCIIWKFKLFNFIRLKKPINDSKIVIVGDNVSLSQLTIRMLFNYGGILQIVYAILFMTVTSVASLYIYSLFVVVYSVFLIVNFVIFVNANISLVDRMSSALPIYVKIIKSDT